MKKFSLYYQFLPILLCFCFTSNGYSQVVDDKDKMKDKFAAHRTAYITQRLELTENEAQKFWPIFNSYIKDRDQLRASNTVDVDKLSEKEAEAYVNGTLDRNTKELDLHKQFIQKVKSVLPMTKVAKLINIEREMKHAVMNNVKKKGGRHHHKHISK